MVWKDDFPFPVLYSQVNHVNLPGCTHFTPFFNNDPTPNRPFHPSFPVFGRWGSFFSGDRNDIYLRSFRQVWEWVGWLDPVGTSHLEPGPFKWWFFCTRNGNPRKFQGKSRLVKYFFCIIWPDFFGGKKLVLP